jgi:hypothetical protein
MKPSREETWSEPFCVLGGYQFNQVLHHSTGFRKRKLMSFSADQKRSEFVLQLLDVSASRQAEQYAAARQHESCGECRLEQRSNGGAGSQSWKMVSLHKAGTLFVFKSLLKMVSHELNATRWSLSFHLNCYFIQYTYNCFVLAV